MPYQVEIEIDDDGQVVTHVKGMKGKGCLKIIGDLEKALGRRVGEVRPTPEMHETERVAEKVRR